MTAKHSNQTVSYSHTTFEWDKSPYGAAPDRIKMVQHFVASPKLEEFSVGIEVEA